MLPRMGSQSQCHNPMQVTFFFIQEGGKPHAGDLRVLLTDQRATSLET